ncbi:hypothetical protein OC844_006680 [Tilletia horrida]|nr:hypothetical protein OC844_006680 [Tilletia horrida]
MSSNPLSRFFSGALSSAASSSASAGTSSSTLATSLYTLGSLCFQYSPLIAPVLIWIKDAPHGRFAPKVGSSWTVHGNYGWLVMEIVSPLTFLASLLSSGPLASRTGNALGSWAPKWGNFAALPLPNRILAACFVLHYLHRAVISPLTSPTRSRMHISVPISAIGFNLINGFLMGSWIGGHSPPLLSAAEAVKAAVQANANSGSARAASSLWGRKAATGTAAAHPAAALQSLQLGPGLIPTSALQHPLFWLGLAGWAIGFAGNIYHDEILANLRRKPRRSEQKQQQTNGAAKEVARKADKDEIKSRYKVPHGALFELVSFPNYLCEWFEWASFAFSALYFLPLWSTAAASTSSSPLKIITTLLQTPPFLFLLAEVSAMLPRAYKGHLWYRDTFGDELPRGRKAVIPFVF